MPEVTWLSYTFNVYLHDDNWADVAGIYIFCGINSKNQWVAYYIGKTESFQDRIPSHKQWEQAVKLGATHAHAKMVSQAKDRDRIEEELIKAFQPRLNTQLREQG